MMETERDHEASLKYAYEMGYDCGKHGANTTNCNFALFRTKEMTSEWQKGKRDGEKKPSPGN